MNKTLKLVVLSLSIYVIWTFITFILEGRIDLLHTNDPVGRLEYVVIANILVGTFFGFIMLKTSLKSNFVTKKQLGFQSSKRILILVFVAASVGLLLFSIESPASLNPVVIANVFSQTLPTSIAEVVVCWAVVGTTFESLTRERMDKENDITNKKNGVSITRTASVLSVIIASIVSTALFGLYHFAHSPPFNQTSMVIFLMMPAILTTIFYFVGREIYSTITVHNFLALIGVSGGVDVTQLAQPLYPIMILALVSVLVLIISDLFLVRRTKLKYI